MARVRASVTISSGFENHGLEHSAPSASAFGSPVDGETVVEAGADASAGHLHGATRLKEVDALATRATTLFAATHRVWTIRDAHGTAANDVHSASPAVFPTLR